MRKVIYLYVVIAMALPAIMTPVLWWSTKFAEPNAGGYFANLITLFSLTGNSIPSLLYALLPPSILREGANAAILALVARRLWMYAKARSFTVPQYFRGLLFFLGAVAFTFFALAWVGGFVAGLYAYVTGMTGIPIGVASIALIPTSFALPTSFILTELMSFRRPQHEASQT
ncbi:MAG: hypothetical protein IPH73_03110 [Rhodocyclales bacterium]|nr:hypothetical protein [Rhodocyclales bacterium]